MGTKGRAPRGRAASRERGQPLPPGGCRYRRGSLTSCQPPSNRAASAGRAMGTLRRRRNAPGAADTARAPPRGHPAPGPPRAPGPAPAVGAG